MQLLPLLIPVLCFLVAEAARLDGWKNRTNALRDSVKDRSRNRFAKMSSEMKQRLGKQIGDLDARKARLGRLKRQHKELSPQKKAELKEKLAHLTPIQMERPNEDVPINLMEVNMKEGVTEFMYQGDIDLTDEQVDNLKESSDPARRKRQATTVASKWSGNTVYYYFDSTISARKKSVVAAALQYIQSRTCVSFVQSSTATNRIRVTTGAGCFSSIGMIGKEQTLSMGDGCEQINTAAHEFMHALGIWHMQQKSERDDYVTIDMTYVPEASRSNFDKLTSSNSINYTPYEYGSIMHYDSNSFAEPSDQLTIIPKDTTWLYNLGNIQPSFYDIAQINKHYGCDAACPAATSAKCYNGGQPNPRNCAVCLCPFGYAGALCDQRPAGCGETLTATSSWQTKSFSYGDVKDQTNVRDTIATCNYMIYAPAGQMLEIQIVSMYNTLCQNGCPFNGMEIKTNPDPRLSQVKYCCPEYANKTILSYNNPTPLFAFNTVYYTAFTFKYRAVALPPTPRKCQSMLSAEDCASHKAAGFCTSPEYSFQIKKYSCASECGLCGQAATPCVDLQEDCPELALGGACAVNDPMVLEYQCAKSCGYCVNPN